MKIITVSILMFILIPICAYSGEIAITYGLAGELVLKSKSCDKLIQEHQSICSWKKTNEPEFIIPKIPRSLCKLGKSKTYSMKISSCLPNFVKTNHNKKLIRSGANCWGTAMSFKKLSTKPRFVWPEEISYWMNTPVCRKLSVGENKEPGDIINIYGPEYIFGEIGNEGVEKGYQFWEALYPGRTTLPQETNTYSGFHNFLHSETYISNELSFGKDSPSKDDRFKFHSKDEIYGRSREIECQENQSLAPYSRENQNSPRSIKGSKCDYFSIVYRCGSIEDYFSKAELSKNEKKLLKDIQELKLIQDKIFSFQTLTKISMTKIQIKIILDNVDKSANESLEELKVPNLEKNYEMLLVLRYFTAAGIRKTFEQSRLIPATEPL